ncbi:4-coumarate--CoA ligase-like 6 [Vitis vinifera]|uniref:4-coumarate--CoA ligase n=1 Tax=Vitis vinifera TaxID=29760 RepID=A0A438HYT5_VITVI|nr:4-coumarate--CoA ligase-like 6 [Vitis vinifera]
MATPLNACASSQNQATNTQRASDNTHPNGHPHWFSPETGIYSSTYPSLPIPSDPHLDIVSFIFSKNHNGVSALTDYSSGFSISYSQLHPLVKSMASGLHQMGFSQGDVILLLLPNSIYFPVIFLAVLSLGGIATTMNPLSSLTEIRKQTVGCSLSLAFTVPETSGETWSIRPVINQHDVAAIMYSSGTTGSTKAVVLTHGNFIAMVETFVRFEASLYENSGSENVYLAVLPMFHIYGLSLFVTGLISLGSAIVVMRKFDANEMVKAIDRYRVCCGAAPLTQKSIQEFVQTLSHVDLIQGYGMTESTAVGTRGFNTKKLRNYSSIGLLAPNMRAKVVDLSSGSLLPPGNCGELWLQGPGIMKGYLNDEEATISTIDKEGWLHTGDIVSFDQDGYLYMFSRIKEIIKYKGFQIAPVDLESILISHPEISDAAVAGTGKQIHEQICYNLTEMWSWSPPEIDNSVVELRYPVCRSLLSIYRVGDEEAGEVPVAFVVKRPGSALSQAAIINYVEKQVAPYKKVRKVIFTHPIPKSAAGKILRRELKHLFMISRI